MSLYDIVTCVDTPFANYMLHFQSICKDKLLRAFSDFELKRRADRAENALLGKLFFRLPLRQRKIRREMARILMQETTRRQNAEAQHKAVFALRACCRAFRVIFTTTRLNEDIAQKKIDFVKSYDGRISSSLTKTTRHIQDKWVSTCVDKLQRPRISHVAVCVQTVMNEEIRKHVKFVEECAAKRRRVEQTFGGLEWIKIQYDDE